MIVMTSGGAFAVTQAPGRPGELLINAAVHTDAAALVEWYGAHLAGLRTVAQAVSSTTLYGLTEEPDPTAGLPEPRVYTRQADPFPWQVVLPASAWAAYLAEAAEDVDYSNFLRHLRENRQWGRAVHYARILGEVERLQVLDGGV